MPKFNPFQEDPEEDVEKSISSYSDLFAAISFCFLFLYIIASINSSVKTVQSQIEMNKVQKDQQEKIKHLIKQYEDKLALYEVEKENYLKSKDPSSKEVAVYEEAIKNLKYLEEQSSEEAKKLKEQLTEAQKKETALNQYQELIKNIVTSNITLKHKIVTQEKTFEETISQKEKSHEQEKVNLAKSISQKMQSELKQKVQEVKESERSKYEKKMEALAESKQKQIERIQGKFEKELQKLGKEKRQSHEEKQNLQAKYKALAASRDKSLRELESNFQGKLAEIGEALNAKSQEAEEVKGLLQTAMQGKTSEVFDSIGEKLAENFKKKGISASVDTKSGEVTLNFKEVYFDLGEYKLKPEMEKELSQFIPVLMESLMGDPVISTVLSSIEIVGFASPIFDNKYVDPNTLKVKNFQAVNYNLDLSYKRSRSIFQYIFNPQKLSYKYQDEVFKITKVSGRSFLDGKKVKQQGRVPASELSKDQYCEMHDCKSQQKVIIKYHVKE